MNHEKLNCYNRLVGITERIARLMARWPRGYGNLADQLRRALTSAVLNLAEVSACLDLCASFSLFKPLEIAEFKESIAHSYAEIRLLP